MACFERTNVIGLDLRDLGYLIDIELLLFPRMAQEFGDRRHPPRELLDCVSAWQCCSTKNAAWRPALAPGVPLSAATRGCRAARPLSPAVATYTGSGDSKTASPRVRL